MPQRFIAICCKLKKDYESGKSLKSVRVATTWSPQRKWRLALAAVALSSSLLPFSGGPRVLRRMAASGAASPPVRASLVPERKSIAVLPFADIAGDPKMSAFGKGLLEDVAAKLSQLSANHDLEVVSARTLEDKKVTTLADAKQEFGVSLGLTLSLEQAGDLVRAAYSLTDAKSGKNLAGAQITAPVSDLFTIEDQIANGVASALQISLRSDEKQAFGAHSTSLPEAYQYFVQGRGYLQDWRKPENLTSAEIVFKQALKIDPNFGQAEAGLGQTYWLKYQLTQAKAVDRSRAAGVHQGRGLRQRRRRRPHVPGASRRRHRPVRKSRRAIPAGGPVRTSERPGVHQALRARYQHLNQPDKAEETYKRAIAVRPQYWRLYSFLGGFYIAQAEYDKAAAMFRRSTELEPDSYPAFNNLGGALLYAGKDAEAAQAFEKSIAIRPTYDAYSNIAVAQFHLRRFRDSVASLKEALKVDDRTTRPGAI